MSADNLELTLFVLYFLLGPLMWAFYGYMLVAGRRKMLLLRRPAPRFDSNAPSVTILIPAKDEGERIRACIDSVLAQNYPNFDIITIDDRSADNTGAVMDEIAKGQARMRVLHILDPPLHGWTGKNNALNTGQKLASGDWLLFVDSDVVLQPDALSASMAVVQRKKFDLISLLPRLESHTIWESLLVPLAASAASSMYLIALSNNNLLPNIAFANGQFLMVKREAYDAIGGHETVRDRYCEDVEIARLLKTSGWRPRVSWANDFCSVRMYSSLGAIFRGWGRIFYSARTGSPWRVLAAIFFIVACCYSIWPALAFGIYRLLHPSTIFEGYSGIVWITCAIIHLILLTWFVAILYQWSGNPRRNAFLFPIAAGMLLAIFFKAIRMCITKKVEWRGTEYSHTMASQSTPLGTR